MELARRIEAIYRQHDDYFLPYVGDAYTDARPQDLRVLALGINAYVGARESVTDPGWFRSWVEERAYRYQKRLVSEVQDLADAPVFAQDAVAPSASA